MHPGDHSESEPDSGPAGPGAQTARPQARDDVVADVAERAAAEIRHRAGQDARRELEAADREAGEVLAERQRMVSDLMQTAAGHLAAVRDEAERMLETIHEGVARMQMAPGRTGPVRIGGGRGRAMRSGRAHGMLPRRTAPPAEAVALASRMLAAGTERREVERRLREDHDVADPGSVVDGVIAHDDA